MSIGEDTNILSFDDALTVRGYAIPAMQWACGSGLVTGIAQNGGMLLPLKDTTTRVQAATLMMRAASGDAANCKRVVTNSVFKNCTASLNGIIQIDSNS